MSDEKKQKLKEYQKKISRSKNSFFNNDLIVYVLFRQTDGDKSLTMHD